MQCKACKAMLYNHLFSQMIFSIAFIPQSAPFSGRDIGSLKMCTDLWFTASEDVNLNQLQHMLPSLKSIQKNGQGRILPGDPHSSRHLFSKWFKAGRDCSV